MTLQTLKQDLIKQYSRLLDKKYISAFKTILSPCCTISGRATASCIGIQTFNVTITLDQPIPAFPAAYAVVYATTSTVAYAAITGLNTFTVTITFIGGGITNVTEDLQVSVSVPTGAGVGVYHTFVIPAVVFNGNPCD